jgi:hypothetical protein
LGGLGSEGRRRYLGLGLSPRCSIGGRMSLKSIYIVFNIVGLVLIGGSGFLMYRYPRFFADLNARFGFRRFSTPKHIAFTRRLGIVEMILAGVFAVSLVVSLIFGVNSY